MQQFFYSAPVRVLEMPFEVTEILSSEIDSEGNCTVVKKDIQSFVDSLSLLSYSDFTLSEMIKNGVTYDSLNITDDMRLGHESEYADFETRFKALESQIFTDKPVQQ